MSKQRPHFLAHVKIYYFHSKNSVMEVMKQLDQGEIAATARARLHGDMVHPRSEIQVSRPQAPRPVPPAMNPAFSYPGEKNFL